MSSSSKKFNLGYYAVIYGLVTIIMLSIFYNPEADAVSSLDAFSTQFDMRGLNVDTELASNLKTIKAPANIELLPQEFTLGTTNIFVIILQQRLMELGYLEDDEPSQVYGESISAAVKIFQRQLDKEQTGICTYDVWDQLFSINAPVYSVKRGATGDDIKRIQSRLYELGYLSYDYDINGYYGEKTEEAIRVFQKKNKREQTGQVTLATLDLLHNPDAIANTIVNGEQPEIIKKYQTRLMELGYFVGRIDGRYTEEFRSAVKDFQITNKQVPDGFIGPTTRFVLDSKYAKPYSTRLGQANERVEFIQERLVELKYLTDQLQKGYYGKVTAQAVANFQEDNGLPITGRVDIQTLTLLVSPDTQKSVRSPIWRASDVTLDFDSIHVESDDIIGNVEDLIKVARLKLGAKYIWGTQGPSTFDCSGFVNWCLNQVGLNVPYMSSLAWRKPNRFVKIEDIEDLERGDLILLTDHVGIMTDDKTVIDASSSNGKVVERKITNWWRKRFVCGWKIFDPEGGEAVEK